MTSAKEKRVLSTVDVAVDGAVDVSVDAAVTVTGLNRSNKRRRLNNSSAEDGDGGGEMLTDSNLEMDVDAGTDIEGASVDVSTCDSSSVALCMDVFSIVMSMLSPRDMLRLSRCSKSLMNMVTHENVVRNTIMVGGHAKKSLKAILDLLRDRKIYFPSPMRLLRIACGLKCEIPGCSKTVHTIRSHYGVFCCSTCTQQEDTTFSISLNSDTWSTNATLRDIVNHAQTCSYIFQRKASVWRSPWKALDGERCGPLVTMDGIQACLEKNQTLVEYISSLDCEYDSDLLGALLKLDESTTEKAAVNEEREKEEREKRVKLFRIQKAEKLEEVLAKVESILDPRWKNFALRKYYYSTDGWSRFRDFRDTFEYNPKFESQLMRNVELLDKAMHAPSRFGVQKKVTKMADAIDKVFERIFDKGFHDFSFLSSDKDGEPFEAYLRDYMKEKFNVEDWLLSLDQHDIDKLEEYGPLVALACKLTGEKARPWRAPPCFSVAVVPYIKLPDKKETDEDFARALWTLKTYERECPSFSQRCRATFEYTVQAFKTLRPRIMDYLNHPTTVAFLALPQGRNESWLRVKREELNKVWTDRELLMHFLHDDVDFEELRAEQAAGAELRWLGGHW